MSARNPLAGDVALTTADGVTYTLRYDINALIAMEAALGAPLSELEPVLERPSAAAIRTILTIGLQRHHPCMTEEAVGALDVSMQAMSAAMTAAIGAAFGAADTDAAGGGGTAPADPPTPRSTGSASSPKRSRAGSTRGGSGR